MNDAAWTVARGPGDNFWKLSIFFAVCRVCRGAMGRTDFRGIRQTHIRGAPVSVCTDKCELRTIDGQPLPKQRSVHQSYIRSQLERQLSLGTAESVCEHQFSRHTGMIPGLLVYVEHGESAPPANSRRWLPLVLWHEAHEKKKKTVAF